MADEASQPLQNSAEERDPSLPSSNESATGAATGTGAGIPGAIESSAAPRPPSDAISADPTKATAPEVSLDKREAVSAPLIPATHSTPEPVVPGQTPASEVPSRELADAAVTVTAPLIPATHSTPEPVAPGQAPVSEVPSPEPADAAARAAAGPEPVSWASPADRAAVHPAVQGPGPEVSLSKAAASTADWPAPNPWAPPVGHRPHPGPGNTVFAGVGGAQAPVSFQAPASWPAPAAQPHHGYPVPPPPIAPDGPGQLPYGYPAQPGHGMPYGVPPGYYGWSGANPVSRDGMGLAGMVLGILAAIGFCLWPLAIVLGVLAVIFGGIGRARANRGEAPNPGQALTGIICGSVGIVLALVVLAAYIADAGS